MESSRSRLRSASPPGASARAGSAEVDRGRAGPSTAGLHSNLAEAREGDRVQVTGIVFELVRLRSWKSGIVPGGRYDCLGRDPESGDVTLVNSCGERVTVEKDLARFISTVTDGRRREPLRLHEIHRSSRGSKREVD